jgi:hypothetical protein
VEYTQARAAGEWLGVRPREIADVQVHCSASSTGASSSTRRTSFVIDTLAALKPLPLSMRSTGGRSPAHSSIIA